MSIESSWMVLEMELMSSITLKRRSSARPIRYPMNNPTMAILKERRLNFLNTISKRMRTPIITSPPITP